MSARAAFVLGSLIVLAALVHGGVYSAGHDFVVNRFTGVWEFVPADDYEEGGDARHVRLPTLTVSGGSRAPVMQGGPRRVGRGFISLYALSFAGGSLVMIAPLLVSLALKVNSLVGLDQAPKNLALVTGVGSLLAMVSNPFFGRLSDRTTARIGMRRPWMLIGLAGGTAGTLTVAVAPSIPVVLLGWCITQVFFNALLAAQVAVLHDQVPGPLPARHSSWSNRTKPLIRRSWDACPWTSGNAAARISSVTGGTNDGNSTLGDAACPACASPVVGCCTRGVWPSAFGVGRSAFGDVFGACPA